MSTNRTKRENAQDAVAAAIISNLEEVKASDWERGFNPFSNGEALNASTGKPLQGVSQLLAGLVSSQEKWPNRWVTFSQAMIACGFKFNSETKKYVWLGEGEAPKPLKGEKSVKFAYAPPPMYWVDGKLKSVNKLTPDERKKVDEGELFPQFIWKNINYFNVAQIEATAPGLIPKEWLHLPERRVFNKGERIAEIDVIAKNKGINIVHEGDQPCFSPVKDTVFMPDFEQYHSPEHYYADLLHEEVHWTGRSDRLERIKPNSSKETLAYSFEEVVAEMGAAMLCSHFGFKTNLRHTEYVKGWLKAFKNDPSIIIDAAKESKKAVNYLLD